jgi:hypothetical protein
MLRWTNGQSKAGGATPMSASSSNGRVGTLDTALESPQAVGAAPSSGGGMEVFDSLTLRHDPRRLAQRGEGAQRPPVGLMPLVRHRVQEQGSDWPMRRRWKWSGFRGVSNATTICRSTYTSLSPVDPVAAEATGGGGALPWPLRCLWTPPASTRSSPPGAAAVWAPRVGRRRWTMEAGAADRISADILVTASARESAHTIPFLGAPEAFGEAPSSGGEGTTCFAWCPYGQDLMPSTHNKTECYFITNKSLKS